MCSATSANPVEFYGVVKQQGLAESIFYSPVSREKALIKTVVYVKFDRS